MEYTFRSLTDGSIIDLIPYVKDKLSSKDGVSLYIGTDSQNIGNKTHYAVVVVLHYPSKGGHVLYSKVKFDRIRDRFTKLWKEIEISVEIAEHLKANGIIANFIDIDINPDPKYGSNNVLRAAMGWIESLGYVGRCKPDAAAASYAADKLCK